MGMIRISDASATMYELDAVASLADTARLSCQIIDAPALDGLSLRLDQSGS